MLSVETRGRLIRDEANGHDPRAVLVSRDVTETVAAGVVLKEAKEAAERANAAKSEFMSRMSHELRTPLNSVLGFAQILEMELRVPRRTRNGGLHPQLGQVPPRTDQRSPRHLAHRVWPHQCVDRTDCPARPREGVHRTRDPQANELGASRSSRSPRYDFQVLGDQQRLKQVLLNLLSNAIKYNRPNGSVTISCTPKPRSKVRLSVTDTGPGISPDLLERLFTPFDRLDAETSGIEGTGLGLALSKGLVEAIGGTIGVDSVVGQGSTFWIELPNVKSPRFSPSSTQPTLAMKAANDASLDRALHRRRRCQRPARRAPFDAALQRSGSSRHCWGARASNWRSSTCRT
jgi:signal transduction histidine kinase